MPHFVIDCSENVIVQKSSEEIIQIVYDAAESTNLFDEGDVKVRINPFKYFTVGNSRKDFIHVFAYVMEGRTADQKQGLSNRIVSALAQFMPNVPIISMNIKDFERASYCNKSMV